MWEKCAVRCQIKDGRAEIKRAERPKTTSVGINKYLNIRTSVCNIYEGPWTASIKGPQAPPLAPVSPVASSRYLLSTPGKRTAFSSFILVSSELKLLFFPHGNFIPPIMVNYGVRVQPIVSHHLSSPFERFSLGPHNQNHTTNTIESRVDRQASMSSEREVWGKEYKINQNALMKFNVQKWDEWKVISEQTPPSLVLEFCWNYF